MKIKLLTYQFTNSRNLKKSVFACLFLVFLVANPIFQITNAIQDIKYELADASDKEELTNQETVSELENETNLILYFSEIYFQIELLKHPSFFIIQSSLSNYKQNIQLPPPRVI